MALIHAFAVAAFAASIPVSSGLGVQNVDARTGILPSLYSHRPPVQTDSASDMSTPEAIWAGIDSLFENVNLSSVKRSLFSHGGDDEKVVLLGPMDSGTHLLHETLSRNFPDEFESACHGTTEGCRWIWKHSLGIDGIVRTLTSSTGNALGKTTIVAIVRSPFSQLATWREDPWDMEECVRRWWSGMIKPCSAQLGATLPKEHIGLASSVVPKLNFSSTVDIVNQYYAQYARLQALGLFKQVLVLRYEDLVYAPTAMTKRLGFHLGWPVPSTVVIPDAGVKKSSSACRASAIEAVRQRSYLDTIPTAWIPVLCGLLNQTVQSELNFVEVGSADIEVDGDLFPLAPQYMSDCNLGAF